MPAALDLTGKRFGRLTVTKLAICIKWHKTWQCMCDCGKHVVVYGTNLRRGMTRSCGCLQANKPKHGGLVDGIGSPEYQSWKAMRMRCHNKRHKYFHYYGGRGISVCTRWDNFVNFYSDMGKRPEGRSLDRIDGNGNYEPLNCRWATRKEQRANQLVAKKAN